MIIDGKQIAQNILDKLRDDLALLPFQPIFCDVLVGDDKVSSQYVEMKAATAEKIGIKFQKAEFPGNIDTASLVAEIKKLNGLPHMAGLIVQLPLPPHLDRQAVLNAIDPKIDVDCIGETNGNLFYQGNAYLPFPTAAAILEILDSLNLDLAKKEILVVGKGDLVGKPTAFMLKHRGLKVTTADTSTPNTIELIKSADIVISATGQGKLIHGNIVKPGSVIIDAGTSESAGGIIGDVDTFSVSGVAGFVSPVPGGVGPVTVAMLMKNIITVAKATA